MKRILVPTDFSAPSKASYKFALELAAAVKGEIYVVHMIEFPMIPETTFGVQPLSVDPRLFTELEEKIKEAFEEIKKQYLSTVPVSFRPVYASVIPGIRLFIEQNNIDLVIMSTHGATGLGEFFFGSTAEKIARLSPVPVIAIRKEVSFSSIKNIVFPNTLVLDQKVLMDGIKELQSLCKATLHVLLINTPMNFNSDADSKQLLEKFAKHFDLQNFTLNFRNNQHETTGITSFLNEIKGDMVAMATHGRIGLTHFVKGSIAESVINHIDHPVWTYREQK